MSTHIQRGEGLQSTPFGRDETWQHDKKLKAVYEANAPLILENHREGPIESIYNVPVANDISLERLMSELENVYHRRRQAFRINVSLGVILRNAETGEYRYFRPHDNDTLFDQPIVVTRRSDLVKLRERLSEIDFTTYFIRNRPSTAWKPYLFTNIRISVYGLQYALGCPNQLLPDYIAQNKSLHALQRDDRTQVHFTDHLCAFRCLALHRGYDLRNLEQAVVTLLNQWLSYAKDQVCTDASKFRGVQYCHFPDFETCFKVNLHAYRLTGDGAVVPLYQSRGRYETDMFVNVHKNHLSYIKDFKAYARKYQCSSCERHFERLYDFKRHRRTCSEITKYVYPGGFQRSGTTIFDQLEELGVCVPSDRRTYPWFAVYDFEALVQKVEGQATEKMQWTHRHVPISVSISSNVPGFTEPSCIVDVEPKALVARMMDRLQLIAAAANRQAKQKWGEYEKTVGDMVKAAKEEESDVQQDNDDEEDDGTIPGRKSETNHLKSTYGRLIGYMTQLPVLGFNSSRYDLNLVKRLIARHLRESENLFIIKKSNAYASISTDDFRFLDISHFLAPGTSYAKFLRAYGVEEQKGYFPYDWFDDVEKLKATSLPPHASFYSHVKDHNITEEEYAFCAKTWEEKGMETFRDFLEWYNNLDAGPFVTAVERLQSFYFEKNLDVFKNTISVPGLARQMLFDCSRQQGIHFSLFDKANADLYQTVKQNIVGGPSIIFKRHHEVGKTLVRGGKPCRKIVGYDANALYLWAIGEKMPVGAFVRRRAEHGFKPELRDKYMSAYHWMDYLSHTRGVCIQHYLNSGKEKRVGKFPVDGWIAHTNTILQFQGCYWHGHSCDITANVKDQKWLDTRQEKFDKTVKTTEYLQSQGYEVVEMWECQFQRFKRDNPAIYDFIRKRRPVFYQKHPGKVDERQIIQAVQSDQLFGMVEVDIEVPTEWPGNFRHPTLSPYQYFQEMSPLFCNTEVPYDIIGDHMQVHAKRFGLSEKPRRLLVGGMKAKQMLIATPLLKWYVEHGMRVTKIYQVVEYANNQCFRQFVEDVSNARREGDEVSEKSIIADTMKLIGNSGYGSLIMDKTKHRTVNLMEGERSVCMNVNDPRFRKLECVDEEKEIYEMEMAKGRIRLDLPIQLGYFILQYAKLRMLQFHYDFLDAYVDRSDYELLETDTDSLYFAITADTLEEAMTPEWRRHFNEEKRGHCNDISYKADCHWVPRTCCEQHAKYDKRTPGLFKLEYEGHEMIGLCSKTYIVAKTKSITPSSTTVRAKKLLNRALGRRTGSTKPRTRATTEKKFSSKGISKRSVKAPLSVFRNVLKTQKVDSGTNRGFRARHGGIFSYEQKRNGFTYFYCKRKVLDDGVSTEPLDI
ncbi:hypothetical protein ScPMuIL_004722, partial [Solemya velum]